MSNKAKSLREVNKAIHKIYPRVNLVRGKGYYYIASDDDEMALKIASLYTSSICVYSIKQQSVQRWVDDVIMLLTDTRNKPL